METDICLVDNLNCLHIINEWHIENAIQSILPKIQDISGIYVAYRDHKWHMHIEVYKYRDSNPNILRDIKNLITKDTKYFQMFNLHVHFKGVNSFWELIYLETSKSKNVRKYKDTNICIYDIFEMTSNFNKALNFQKSYLLYIKMPVTEVEYLLKYYGQ